MIDVQSIEPEAAAMKISRDSCRRRYPTEMLAAFVCGWAIALVSSTAAADNLEVLAKPGYVLLLRHANAPGVGDPPGMSLEVCSTQRNLDERGRAQARRLGERLRTAGLRSAQVYTSEWCRCRETARLLNIGAVNVLKALNSTFGRPEQQDERTAQLRDFIGQLPRNSNAVVLITHQITITALTGYFPASGEGLILRLGENGSFMQVGEVASQ